MNSKGSISSRRLRAQAEHLDWLYPIPDPMDTWEQSLKRTHGDLGDMDRPHLHVEMEQLRLRLLLDPQPHPWLRERLVAIREAIRRAR